MSDTIGAFFTAWGERDPDRRKRALERVLAPHFTYADPNGMERVSGIAAMSDVLAMFTRQMPEASARVVRHDEHHQFHRCTVDFMKDTETRMMRGQYFIETDEDGRLLRAAGFIGMGEPE